MSTLTLNRPIPNPISPPRFGPGGEIIGSYSPTAPTTGGWISFVLYKTGSGLSIIAAQHPFIPLFSTFNFQGICSLGANSLQGGVQDGTVCDVVVTAFNANGTVFQTDIVTGGLVIDYSSMLATLFSGTHAPADPKGTLIQDIWNKTGGAGPSLTALQNDLISTYRNNP